MWLPLRRLRRLDGWTLVGSLRPTALRVGGSCAVAHTSVSDGITARGADDGIGFVLALNLGESEFGIMQA
jgi:hypothetical protein